MKDRNAFCWREYLRRDLYRYRRQRDPAAAEPSGMGFLLGTLSPRFVPVLLARTAHKLHLLGLSPVARAVSLINFLLFGIEIAVRCPIGPGLILPHTHGTVIGANSIGADATIFQGVTLGAKEVDFGYAQEARPTVGDGVVIGSGAKVLGGLTIGDGVRIGANSVVLRTVPANCLVVGVPGQVVEKRPQEE
jgi:serine O-acetyltransferase